MLKFISTNCGLQESELPVLSKLAHLLDADNNAQDDRDASSSSCAGELKELTSASSASAATAGGVTTMECSAAATTTTTTASAAVQQQFRSVLDLLARCGGSAEPPSMFPTVSFLAQALDEVDTLSSPIIMASPAHTDTTTTTTVAAAAPHADVAKSTPPRALEEKNPASEAAASSSSSPKQPVVSLTSSMLHFITAECGEANADNFPTLRLLTSQLLADENTTTPPPAVSAAAVPAAANAVVPMPIPLPIVPGAGGWTTPVPSRPASALKASQLSSVIERPGSAATKARPTSSHQQQTPKKTHKKKKASRPSSGKQQPVEADPVVESPPPPSPPAVPADPPAVDVDAPAAATDTVEQVNEPLPTKPPAMSTSASATARTTSRTSTPSPSELARTPMRQKSAFAERYMQKLFSRSRRAMAQGLPPHPHSDAAAHEPPIASSSASVAHRVLRNYYHPTLSTVNLSPAESQVPLVALPTVGRRHSVTVQQQQQQQQQRYRHVNPTHDRGCSATRSTTRSTSRGPAARPVSSLPLSSSLVGGVGPRAVSAALQARQSRGGGLSSLMVVGTRAPSMATRTRSQQRSPRHQR